MGTATSRTPGRALAALRRRALRRLGRDDAFAGRLRRTEERLETIVAGARGIIYISELGPRGRWRYVSPRIEEMLGFTASEWTAEPGLWIRQLHPGDRDAVVAEEEELASHTTGELHESEYRLLTRSGDCRWIRDAATIVAADDGTLVWSGVLNDITERRAVEEELKASEDRFRTVVETASDAFVSMDANGLIVEWNRMAEETFGWRRDEAIGLPVADTIVPERYRPSHLRGFETFLRTGHGPALGRTLELSAVTRDGVEFPVELSIWESASQGVQRINAFLRDITERKELAAVTHQAFHDALTNLPNRVLFTDRVAQALARRPAPAAPSVAVLLLDLDDFKTVNDSLGHAAGDQLLVEVATRLASCVRPGDTLARLAGDEFSVLLEGIEDLNEVTRVARRIGERLEKPFEIEAMEVVVRASIGIAVGRHAEVRPEEMMRDADVAMYAAKARGKGEFELFQPQMRHAVVTRMELKGDLRRALDRDELRVHYQPYVLLDGGRVVGAEALVRWEHPERGLIPPLDFIPLAEEMGLIVPIGRWVLHEACGRAVEWTRRFPELGSLTFSVNVSARQLQDGSFVDDVATVVAQHDLEPKQLVLELTESCLVEDPDNAVKRLRELNDLGVSLAIDDFGTGYSSLSYLQRYPIEILKVHRSFVSALGRSADESSMTRAILQLAENLGMATIAEGVEEPAQVAALVELGCVYAQGFHFSRPLPHDAFAALLEREAALARAVPPSVVTFRRAAG